jgi:hypothetical protein
MLEIFRQIRLSKKVDHWQGYKMKDPFKKKGRHFLISKAPILKIEEGLGTFRRSNFALECAIQIC